VPGGDQGLIAAGAAGFAGLGAARAGHAASQPFFAHSRLESAGISFDYLSMLRA
jgi:hypothetical protein